MNKLTYPKLLTTLLWLTAIACNLWLIHYFTTPTQRESATQSYNADSFAEDVSMLQFQKDGQPRELLQSPQLTHYPQNDLTNIHAPIITYYAPNHTKWILTSLYAQSRAEHTIIQLWEQTTLRQVGSKDKRKQTTLLTQSLTYFPQQNLVQTPLSVTLLQPGTKITALGMRAYLTQEYVQLLSATHGVYNPNV